AARQRWLRLREGFREEEKRQAESEWKAAKADEELAQEEFNRESRIVRGGGARSQYDTARATLDRCRQRSAMGRAKHDLMQAGSRPQEVREAEAEYRRLKATADMLQKGTREEDRALALAKLEEARGRLKELDVLLAEAEVRAAEPAVVELVLVRKG